MTALMVGAARTTEEKIHVHGLLNVSTSSSQQSPTARPALQGPLRSGSQHAGLVRAPRCADQSGEYQAHSRASPDVPPAAGVLNPAAYRHCGNAVPVLPWKRRARKARGKLALPAPTMEP